MKKIILRLILCLSKIDIYLEMHQLKSYIHNKYFGITMTLHTFNISTRDMESFKHNMLYPMEDTQLSVSLNEEQRTCNFNVHVSSRAEDDDEKTK